MTTFELRTEIVPHPLYPSQKVTHVLTLFIFLSKELEKREKERIQFIQKNLEMYTEFGKNVLNQNSEVCISYFGDLCHSILFYYILFYSGLVRGLTISP